MHRSCPFSCFFLYILYYHRYVHNTKARIYSSNPLVSLLLRNNQTTYIQPLLRSIFVVLRVRNLKKVEPRRTRFRSNLYRFAKPLETTLPDSRAQTHGVRFLRPLDLQGDLRVHFTIVAASRALTEHDEYNPRSLRDH